MLRHNWFDSTPVPMTGSEVVECADHLTHLGKFGGLTYDKTSTRILKALLTFANLRQLKRSNPLLMAFHIHITEDAVSWGSKAFTSTEDKLPFIDIALCSDDNRIIGLCSTMTFVRLYSWKLIIQYSTCQPSCSVKWDVPQVIDCISNDFLVQIPVPSPRTEFLKLFFKCTDNSAMIQAYESNKQLHQHNVTQRHLRSQKTRKLNRTVQNSVNKELDV
ncbi:unnamed protein product [Schistosoma turkestanicum]|nr:unnamed protein product [Schistosoma turkestanicum]